MTGIAASARRRRTVVVGAGAAGAPLAARLSRDPAREVVVLEAGSVGDAPPELLDGGLLRGAMPEHPANWNYTAELMPGLPASVARGKLLGGSTATNGGYFIRATHADFAGWSSVGGAAWGFDRALPILKALEQDLDYFSSPMHGREGPVKIARPSQSGPACAAFIAAAQELGFPEEPDKNAGGAPGAGPVPSNIVDGVRINTGAAYLDPVRDRLELFGNTRVLRIGVERGRVTGVETTEGFMPADEVVLSAGAVATPHLLLLSGVGPRGPLEELGIGVVADLPVGVAFSDHPNLAIQWRTRQPVVDWDAGFGFPTALNIDAASVDPGLPSQPEGDIEILLTSKPLSFLLTGRRPQEEALDVMVALQRHEGTGQLSLRSPDPSEQPRIEYRYLESLVDRLRMRVAVRTAARLLQAEAFAEIFGGFTHLDHDVLGDDSALDTWIRAHLGTALHMCGTAPMGPVVDGAGLVRGVAGLRVADTSILPAAPRRGPAATAVFIGELIARRMLSGG